MLALPRHRIVAIDDRYAGYAERVLSAMNQSDTETLRRIHALIACLLQDDTIPGHIADHLTDALVELGPLVHPPHVPAPRSDVTGDSAVALADVQAELPSVIASAATPAEKLAIGRVGRDLAMAEQDLNGRPCAPLRETRDDASALAAIGR
jgi:hypothetical protein